MTYWQISNRANRIAAALADRHYTRQKPGSRQFVPPGRCIVLLTSSHDALWVSSWPFAQYVKHQWAGAWICSLFRNEAPDVYMSSELIRQAVAVTRYIWNDIPPLGMVTFVDAVKVRSVNPGYCYKQAGFHRVGLTKSGLVALQLLPDEMPSSLPPFSAQESLFKGGGVYGSRL
jgi:hypothetical protein